MKKIAIILTNSVDDYELFVPLYIWKEAGFIINLVSIEKKNSILLDSGFKLTCTDTIDKINLSQYNAIYIPGGDCINNFSYQNWPTKQPELIQKTINSLNRVLNNEENKYLFLTEQSLIVLKNFDLLTEEIDEVVKKINPDNEKQYIVKHNNLVITKGVISLNDFALEMIKLLCPDDKDLFKKISNYIFDK